MKKIVPEHFFSLIPDTNTNISFTYTHRIKFLLSISTAKIQWKPTILYLLNKQTPFYESQQYTNCSKRHYSITQPLNIGHLITKYKLTGLIWIHYGKIPVHKFFNYGECFVKICM